MLEEKIDALIGAVNKLLGEQRQIGLGLAQIAKNNDIPALRAQEAQDREAQQVANLRDFYAKDMLVRFFNKLNEEPPEQRMMPTPDQMMKAAAVAYSLADVVIASRAQNGLISFDVASLKKLLVEYADTIGHDGTTAEEAAELFLHEKGLL